ncbi:catalytic subunit of histone acetyltransferase type B [Chloropicon primus]|uniref:histone acetyltransferase n=1 Tax=Chloropicon primus TaxID=1764295 RepID=A0A5B8MWZ5_9CHLO|nr:catalytic subunit of histone acetyltransferase type B [Chloropicon primus]UPR04272.1 catalytic subunit of histone acetyltransferase type B [Chloropicon primus]|eukprot:QDZ25063.1 catalytic subunit of histone acetyltransferase type B [Chloropicon primus]
MVGMEDVQAAKRLKLGGEAEGEDPYVVPAEDVMRLTLVDRPEDVLAEREQSEWFCPAFTHQVFGQDEVVRGYEDCEVLVYLHASTMHAFVKISLKGKQEGADDIPHLLDENLGLQYTCDPQEFAKRVKDTEQALRTALEGARTGPAADCEIVSFKPWENAALRELHDRLQAMPLLYVDGANYIDNTDPRWEIYLALRGGRVAGFATVYGFYAYPARKRLRLSQILVFPPHRRQGVASGILGRIYEDASARGALDLTVEDPSEEFQLLREGLDAKRLEEGGRGYYVGFVDEALRKGKAMLDNGMRAETLLLPSKEVYKRAETDLKIHRAQLRRVWEIVLLRRMRRSGGWENAEDVVRQLVWVRLSNVVGEKKLEERSRGKEVVELNKGAEGAGGNFIMTRCGGGGGGGLLGGREWRKGKMEEGEGRMEEMEEMDAERVRERMRKVVVLG